MSETGIDNKPLSEEAVKHRDQYRFRCPQVLRAADKFHISSDFCVF
jgi:hypothetical protein